MKTFSRLLTVGSACALLLSLSLTAQAARVGGFEPGDPAVTKSGDGSVQQTFQGVTPTEGANQYLITTINRADGDGLTPVSGTNAVLNTTLQTFFNGTGLTGTEGSGFLIPFTVNAGDQFLTLQYDFLTNEIAPGNHNDIAFGLTFNSSNTLIGGVRTITTANLAQSGLSLLANQNGPFQFETGYQPFSISLAGFAPGSYTLGIGVEDRTTSDIPSGVLVDNIQITAAVPEPSTIGLILAGAISCVAVRRRIRK